MILQIKISGCCGANSYSARTKFLLSLTC